MKVQSIPDDYQHISPAGAEVRLLANNHLAGLAHCTLRKGKVSKAVVHKTVSEFWHVIAGSGAIWRKNKEGVSTITNVTPGITIDIDQGTEFQYRSADHEDLVFICFTTPPWSGADEASYVAKGGWEPTP